MNAAPPRPTVQHATSPRPLKGLGYGMLVGTGHGAMAGVTSFVILVLTLMILDPASGGVDGAVIIGVAFAGLAGAGVGLVAGAIAGLVLGACRLEGLAPVGATLSAGAIGTRVMYSLYVGDGISSAAFWLAMLLIGLATAAIGFTAGRWFKDLVESPF